MFLCENMGNRPFFLISLSSDFNMLSMVGLFVDFIFVM